MAANVEACVCRPDISPSLEEQREACELMVTLGPQQFVLVGDERNSAFVRRTTGPKVFGREVHKGVGVVTGILRLRSEGDPYIVELEGVGKVEIKGGEVNGQGRDFLVTKPRGVVIDTNGKVVLVIEAKKSN